MKSSYSDMMSVVIPVRNREHLIGRCLDSVKAQTWRPIRVIVVDNGSTDNTRRIVEDWISHNEENSFQVSLVEESKPGAAVARNRGLREVETEYMLFFDSDDVMHSELVETAMSEFIKHPELDIVHWRIEKLFASGKKRLTKFTITDEWRCHIYHSLFSTQCYAVKTVFFRKSGTWNETLYCWNDWELGIRLLLANPLMKGVNRALATVYHQSDSITGDNFNSKAGEWERAIDATERCVESSGYKDADWLVDMINYRRAILAAHYKHEKRPDLAKPLLGKALSHRTLSLPRKWLLKLLYHYTALGGRGAYLLWK